LCNTASPGQLSGNTRAAVAFEKAKPLEIVEPDLEGPKHGEVLVEIKATGIWGESIIIGLPVADRRSQRGHSSW
jgi:hypothetical protein